MVMNIKNLWNNVKKEHVIKAIQKFEKLNPDYPKPRNTFLVYNGKRYPAKHIRGLAFEIANNKEIKKSEYSGGKETVNFFRKLGFEVEYTRARIKEMRVKKESFSKRLSVVGQKNVLQRILQEHFGIIETEKKFEWLKTPDPEKLPAEYRKIVEALIKYRNQKSFLKPNYSLACDIVIEEHKIIIEYDENQHFTEARKITLENYPENVKIYFDKNYWIEQCNKINARDNHPVDRDEKRAYYDAVRDIEAFKHGYELIRIKHGDFDWTSEDAIEHLNEIITKNSGKHKIARIIVSGKQYEDNGEPILTELKNVFVSFVQDANLKDIKFEFIITPGGFLKFDWPPEFSEWIDNDEANKKLDIFYKSAELKINKFFHYIGSETFEKLKETADYLTIGIDSANSKTEQGIELVAIFDLKKSKVIHWTGKFYPTVGQKLIRINDLNTHFIQLNNQNIVILGCHDLNVFNPRGQAVAKPGSWRRKIADEFKKLCRKFKPDIILQHPHTTDTPNIWNLAWKTVEKELRCVKHYASGIKYYYDYKYGEDKEADKKHKKMKRCWSCINKGTKFYDKNIGHPRGDINEVFAKTKKGDVIDFVYVK